MADSGEIRFDGQVVIITGAGAGLGKAYALQFASRGAKVVVNDLGGSTKGEGKDSRAADLVVNEIRKAGGTAVPDYNSVENGEKVVQTALENFGRIDVVVNNAGILRDKSFARMSDSDWDLVHNVHLRGSFSVTRAAFPHMKRQKHGRILMTSSIAGIYGNFGQANYSAAKLGLVGLSNTVSIEGRSHDVNCNTIAPMGGTRLTEGILPPDLFAELTPDLVAPLVLWLCHPDCEETGGLFETAGGWVGKYRWQRSSGVMCRPSLSATVTPELIRHHWDQISDFSDPLYVESNEEAAGLLGMALEDLKAKGGPRASIDTMALSSMAPNGSKISTMAPNGAKIGTMALSSAASNGVALSRMAPNGSKMSTMALSSVAPTGAKSGPLAAIGFSLKGVPFTYDEKDVILYALSVGYSTRDPSSLQFLYEGSEDFVAMPTFALLASQEAILGGDFLTNIPGVEIDVVKVLHGEQYLSLHSLLPPSGTLLSDLTVIDVLDKTSGAVIIVAAETRDMGGRLVARAEWAVFVVGAGGFGGERSSARGTKLGQTPHRKPDHVDTFKTSVDQAALYRLTGDRNPLHISPEFSSLGGFERPILHGLCSYAVATKAVIHRFCGGDVTRFKAVKSRFARPVVPGQTLVTSMWKEEGGKRIHFEVAVEETGEKCLTGGYVDISNSTDEDKVDFISNDFLRNLSLSLEAKGGVGRRAKGLVILLVVTKEGADPVLWTLDLDSPSEVIYEGRPKGGRTPSSTVTLGDEILPPLLEGGLSPSKAFVQGLIKVEGVFPDFGRVRALLLGGGSKL